MQVTLAASLGLRGKRAQRYVMSNDSADWLSATTDDRKQLYRAIKGAIDVSGLSWQELYRSAIGRNAMGGIGYEDNFRSGRISRSNARRLFDWLRGAHPQRAQTLVKELGWTPPPAEAPNRPGGTAWYSFLDSRATSSGIDIRYPSYRPLPLPPSSGIKSRRDFADNVNPGEGNVGDKEARPAFRIPLGEPFYFRIQSIGGTVVSLSEHRHRWIPERFIESGDALTFQAGSNIAPSRDGKPRPLIEFDDPGLHQFVFIVLKDYIALKHMPPTAIGEAIAPQALDQLAEGLSELSWEFVQVLRIRVLFEQKASS